MMENSQKDNIINPTKSKKESKAPEWLFANIAEASKNARKIYFLYIGFLFYCAFTVLGTPDRYIILNERIKMPILNIDIPLIGFISMAPLIAIFLFIYLQMYLGRLKWLIDLSTNYAPIEKGRLYPWMLNFPKDPEGGLTKELQKIIINFSLWGLLPLVLGLFAYWSLKTHNSLICYVDGIATIIGAIVVLIFWCRYERVQRKVLKFITKNIGKVLLTLITFLFGYVFLFYWIPMALDGELFILNLSNKKLITEPKPDYTGIYWGHFMGAHLERAVLVSTILKRADLRYAHLQYAWMKEANLEGANLWRANLEGANLSGTNLEGANLSEANLMEADPWGANLSYADLSYADLRGADLWRANLSEANLSYTDLRGAKNLFVIMLNNARNRSLAFYDEDILTELGLPSDHNDRVSQRNFSEYNFSEADLSEADLSYADLREADLHRAKNLTIEQLSKVYTLYQAELDPELEKEIKEKYPHLLEKPKEEED